MRARARRGEAGCQLCRALDAPKLTAFVPGVNLGIEHDITMGDIDKATQDSQTLPSQATHLAAKAKASGLPTLSPSLPPRRGQPESQ